MDLQEFTYIQNLLREQTGNILERGKEYLITLRLSPIILEEGYASVPEMIQHLQRFPSKELQQRIVEAMTINETFFFRDEFPYQILQTVIFPELLKKRRDTKTLKIWSAGCSSGQEPYSIALILEEYFGNDLISWDVEIVASDISRSILKKAKSGCYTSFEVKRGLSEFLLKKYFYAQENIWKICEKIQQKVRFENFNLVDFWPHLPLMDVIFLRNVMIYFDLETRKNIFKKLTKILKKDGYLVLGGSENPFFICDSFERIPFEKCSFYQLKQEIK